MIRYITPLISVLLLLSVSCEKRQKERVVKDDEEGIYSVSIIQKNYETKSFELFASEIEFEKDTAIAQRVKVVFFNPDQDTSSILFADRGWYAEKSGNVEVVGNVKVFSHRGDSLFTDTLFYNDSSRKIIAPSRVVIYRQGEKIEGSNLVSDVEFKNVLIGGKVIGKRSGNKRK